MHPVPSGICHWPRLERPRERLHKEGPSKLSDAELIAILIGSGYPGKDATAVARELISVCGGLRGIFARNAHELLRVKGLGPAKVASLVAVTELARRHLREGIVGSKFLEAPEDVLDYLKSALRDSKREIFKVIFLDKGGRILDESDLSSGTVDQAPVHPREIVVRALECHATALVLVHNHPSGRLEPSPQDIEVTETIRRACETVSLTVLDHIIVGEGGFYSFCEHGLLGSDSKVNS